MDINHQLYNINGYNILLLNTDNGNISVKSYIDTGYISETIDNLGINHLIEHVLVNSNSQCEKDCITEMNKKGIIMNASTGLNIINYLALGVKSDLEKIIKFIVETTLNFDNINDYVIEKEKNAVLNELLTNSNNSSVNLLDNLFKNYYNFPGLKNFFNYKQQIENLQKFNSNTLKKFYKEYYNNILFVINGDFNKNLVLNLFNNLLKNKQQGNTVKTSDSMSHCFTLNKEAFFIKNNNIQNTTIIIGFPSIIKNTIYNNIIVDIACKYIKNKCMDSLRATENLIYGIQIEPSMNYCGTSILVTLNVSNNNSKKTIDKFIEIIKTCFLKIDNDFLEGIKKNHKIILNKNNIEEKVMYYENIYINKLFNKCEDNINEFEEFSNMYLDIKDKDIIKLIPSLFNLDNMTLVYSSKKSMI
jgi:predicted Zn-dependent peptidase